MTRSCGSPRIDDVTPIVLSICSIAASRRPTGWPVAGWSYGGYLTQAALAFHPELFVAGISICGMSDLNTFYRTTEPWIAAASYPEYGHPIADHDLLERLSPLPRAEAVTAPLLLVHGGNDTNVPPDESRQMGEALSALGRTVELLIFDDDGHEIAKRRTVRCWSMSRLDGCSARRSASSRQ